MQLTELRRRFATLNMTPKADLDTMLMRITYYNQSQIVRFRLDAIQQIVSVELIDRIENARALYD